MARKEIEKTWGVRYSELHRLPYYDPIRMHVIDPMHNLFLGTAKHMVKVWRETGILDEVKLTAIEEKMKSVKLPTDLGRIPSSISTSFSRMTADEWKKWTLIYSLYCLNGVIPVAHYNMWRCFVSACKLLCSPVVSKPQIADAHNCLVLFCKQFERICGKEYATPNMHLHLHIADCLEDYGPVHAIWCFAFERMNGIIGSIPTNNKDMGIQVMRKFTSVNGLYEMDFGLFKNARNILGLDLPTEFAHSTFNLTAILKLEKIHKKLGITLEDLDADSVTFVSTPAQTGLLDEDYEHIATLAQALNPAESLIRVSGYVLKADRLKVGNTTVAVDSYRNGESRSMYVVARYLGPRVDTHTSIVRPAVVRGLYSLMITFDLGQETRDISFLVAELSWLRPHPYKDFFGHGSPLKIWDTELEPYSAASFVPVQFLKNRYCCVQKDLKFNEQESDLVNIVFELPVSSTV